MSLAAKKLERLAKSINKERLPRHIAIIMDGNGRWAKARGLPRTAGHQAGVESVREVVEACREIGVKYLTIYIFSTENWRRPPKEVAALMRFLRRYLEIELENLHRNKIRLRTIGQTDRLPAQAREMLEHAIDFTSKNRGMTLVLALNYGGRNEIVHGVQRIAEDVASGKLKVSQITEKRFSKYLYTADMPDPDLLIRTSGEYRISNFLLWQLSYSEMYITDLLWPDFGKEALIKAVLDFQQRTRRFGGIEGQD